MSHAHADESRVKEYRMYMEIAALADERVVTHADFAQFVGKETWGTFDFEDGEAVAHVKIVAVREPYWAAPKGSVVVRVNHETLFRAFEPDELAIRIEDS